MRLKKGSHQDNPVLSPPLGPWNKGRLARILTVVSFYVIVIWISQTKPSCIHCTSGACCSSGTWQFLHSEWTEQLKTLHSTKNLPFFWYDSVSTFAFFGRDKHKVFGFCRRLMGYFGVNSSESPVEFVLLLHKKPFQISEVLCFSAELYWTIFCYCYLPRLTRKWNRNKDSLSNLPEDTQLASGWYVLKSGAFDLEAPSLGQWATSTLWSSH